MPPRIESRKKRDFLKKKDSKKLAEFENAFYICTPQNTESSLGNWKKGWEKEAKKKLQNFSIFSCEKQKEVLVLHPL